MKKQCAFIKPILTILMVIALLMSAAGCGRTSGNDSESTKKPELPMQTEGNETNQSETAEPDQTENPEPTQTDSEGELTVDALRQQLKAEDKSFAVAYLGYLTYDHDTLWDFIDGLGDPILQKLPFLNQIPETNMMANAPQGEVYCFVPTDPEAVVELYSDTADMGYDEAFYTNVSSAPYLLVCNAAESPDCYVTITDTLDGEEFTMWWYPKLDQYLYVEQPRYAEGTTGALDISPYNDMLLAYYENMLEDGDWEIPTKADLENTTWYWDGYMLGGDYYEYRVSFREDTADVRWNPGYGETTEYLDAEWDYEDDEISVLTIDFGEFAGVRKYNLLVDWKANMMYITVDATGKDLTWDSEPLYRFLLLDQTDDAQPMDLVGTWDRTECEIEGDITETPAGQVTVKITGATEDDLLISYQDKEFPDNNYSDKALFIIPDGDIWWYGDVGWFAQVNHTGNFGKTFTMAIVDDTLVLQNYFMLDGAPCVSYETFHRVN